MCSEYKTLACYNYLLTPPLLKIFFSTYVVKTLAFCVCALQREHLAHLPRAVNSCWAERLNKDDLKCLKSSVILWNTSQCDSTFQESAVQGGARVICVHGCEWLCVCVCSLGCARVCVYVCGGEIMRTHLHLLRQNGIRDSAEEI